MKFYQFIKTFLLIMVLSSNLMLGQKRSGPAKEARIDKCSDKVTVIQTDKNQGMELRVLQIPPNFALTLGRECLSLDSPDLGAFFQFTAF
jgi:hypothetical protein